MKGNLAIVLLLALLTVGVVAGCALPPYQGGGAEPMDLQLETLPTPAPGGRTMRNLYVTERLTAGEVVAPRVGATDGTAWIEIGGDVVTATVSGGELRIVGDPTSPMIVGGYSGNSAGSAGAAVVGGGRLFYENSAMGSYSFVGGGSSGIASAQESVVCGGFYNKASGYRSAVIGGAMNKAGGSYTMANGYRARADHDGVFIWADSRDKDCISEANDEFRVCAQGGAVFDSFVRVGDSAVACDASHVGAIKFDSSTGDFYGCTNDANGDDAIGDYGWMRFNLVTK